jgi:hypothetical protein
MIQTKVDTILVTYSTVEGRTMVCLEGEHELLLEQEADSCTCFL